MSFILDALKKSENDRQQQAPAEFATVPSSPDTPSAPRWLWALGLLLAINIVALLYVTLRSNKSPPVTTSEQIRSAPEPASAAQSDTDALESQPIAFADQLDEARRKLPERPTTSSGTTGVVASNADSGKPSQSAVAGSANNSTLASANESMNFALLPSLNELRVNGELALPDLHVDIHVFSSNPPDRFVFINMNKYRENDQLSEGPVVREITRDGVILEHRGRAFSLLRE